jgi:hypothetical protein
MQKVNDVVRFVHESDDPEDRFVADLSDDKYVELSYSYPGGVVGVDELTLKVALFPSQGPKEEDGHIFLTRGHRMWGPDASYGGLCFREPEDEIYLSFQLFEGKVYVLWGFDGFDLLKVRFGGIDTWATLQKFATPDDSPR